MVEYKGPDEAVGAYDAKFVRVGEHVSVTIPDDTSTPHVTLAREDGIFNEVVTAKVTNPEDVDGGFLMFSKLKEGGSIRIIGSSRGLSIPTVPEARIKTGELFQKLSPGYEVAADPEKIKM